MESLMVLALLVPQEGSWVRPEEIEQVRTKTAYTLNAAAVELDLVGSVERFNEDGVDLDVVQFFVAAKIGIADWLMAEVDVPYLALKLENGPRASGMGDVVLELKAAVPGNWRGIELGFGVDVSVPTGDADQGLGAEHSVLGFFTAISIRTGRLATHVHFAVDVERGERPSYDLNAALDLTPWGREFSLLLAMSGDIELGEAPAWSFIPGFEYRFQDPDLHFGLGIPIGATDAASRWGLIVDISVTF